MRGFFGILGLFILLSGGASASMPPIDLTCPACQKSFKWSRFVDLVSGSQRDWIWDTASSGRPLEELSVHVASCRSCSYTELVSKFENALDEESAAALRCEALPDGNLGSAFRYTLLAECRSVKGDSPASIGRAFLLAARHGRYNSNPLLGDSGFSRADLLNWGYLPFHEVEPLMATRRLISSLAELEVDERERAAIYSAYTLCELGEYGEVLRQPALPNKGVRRAQALERPYLSKALHQFLLALEDPQTEDPAGLTYLVGELYRRLGEPKLAHQWYQAALDDPNLSPKLQLWAHEQMALLEPAAEDNSQAAQLVATLGLLLAFLLLGRRRIGARIGRGLRF